MEIVEKAQRMLERYPLCDHCLGRQFAFLGYGMSDQERGTTIKTLLTMKAHMLALSKDKKGISLLKMLAKNGSFSMAAQILRKLKRKSGEGETCYLCNGRFELLPSLLEKAAETLQDYEYGTFLVGIKLPTAVEEREDEFKAEFEIQHGESIRNEFSRIIGKLLSETSHKSVDFMKPEIVVLVNPFTGDIRLQVNSLFIMGRYRKLVRGIPQSKWFCPECRGEGCQECNWTGKMHPESVEELIAGPVLERTCGEETSFHGAGREDIDARMLGRGRPFIVQVKGPRKRGIDLRELEQEINRKAEGKIEVRNLKTVKREAIQKLKNVESSEKTYRVNVKFDREVSDEEIENLQESLTESTVIQRTPTRVLHRRADRAREKHIYETRVKRLSPDTIEMKIRCQGGLYVKELVNGDEGRTDPSVSNIVDAKAEPLELDVLDVSVKGGGS
ncbi:MAG: tRNA pseudouridine(54/55) synthase Pus10 [Candidatus Bathyarchaeota archaeon]|nr:tRNA pseudouridine(54/55) synthase Pus10 [Candidatus Bathyarchaeota archaeon]